MRTILALLLMTLLLPAVMAQDEVLDKVADSTCSCVEELKPDGLDHDAIMMKIGLCMFAAAQPYEKELKKKHKLDLSDLEKGAEKLGELVGIRMAMKCPDQFNKLVQYAEEPEEIIAPAIAKVHGTITSVRDRQFSTIQIMDVSGRTIEFLRLEHFPNAELLTGAAATGVKGIFHFVARELFDPASGTYRTHNVLVGLEPE